MNAETSTKWKKRGGANFYLNRSYVMCTTKRNLDHIYTACNCPIWRTCKICAGKHPTGLHGFKLNRKGDNSAFNDDKTSEIIKSNFLPISVIPSVQSSPYENHCKCYKKLSSRSWPMLFTLTIFRQGTHIYTSLFPSVHPSVRPLRTISQEPYTIWS